ncbi:hypothetical protein K435DRAFT_777447 [Dendrothele bispora CBS 962.96]|uniref:Uncharacterized protein n=1 Tax=Dendrothele bispora (strain CBS 962.96) TaxID=1314807 RepID=A0A4S8M8A0_DENBC|nr:hypothetical protein K435DRAFT_777447 [Dendrothele bispora CBS 962.96]
MNSDTNYSCDTSCFSRHFIQIIVVFLGIRVIEIPLRNQSQRSLGPYLAPISLQQVV